MNMRLVSGELEEQGARLRSLDLQFDMAYDGNFRIDVDAVMLLGKVANVSITGECAAAGATFVEHYRRHIMLSCRNLLSSLDMQET